jgi:hypothetical protein
MRIHSGRVLHAPIMLAAIAIVALARLAAAQGHQYSFTLIADSRTFGGPVGGVVSINQGGLVAFAGNNGAGNGIFVGDGTFIDEVALDMNADPGSDYLSFEPITAINSMSEVTFMATKMPTMIGQPFLPGIYKGFPSSGAFTTIAEVDNTTIIQLVGPSSISPGGTVAFKARTLPENHWEVMTSAGAGQTSIANSAQHPLFAGLNSPIINNQGVVAFRGSDQNGQMGGIFKNGPGLPIFISTPDGLTHPNAFDMNNGGRVAFSENTTTPMGSETRILTSANGTSYSVIADVGDPSAGVPAPYFGTGVAINDRGEVLFSAMQPMFFSIVMYVSDGETMWRVEGDPFVNGVGAPVGARAMNNAGQIVFAMGDSFVSQVWRADPLLAGDYNRDGSVDAADYVVWRKTGGMQEGYETWRANFGRTVGRGSNATGPATTFVPEPASAWLLMLAAVAGNLKRRRTAS